mgnify:CR=1 FL=1
MPGWVSAVGAKVAADVGGLDSGVVGSQVGQADEFEEQVHALAVAERPAALLDGAPQASCGRLDGPVAVERGRDARRAVWTRMRRSQCLTNLLADPHSGWARTSEAKASHPGRECRDG